MNNSDEPQDLNPDSEDSQSDSPTVRDLGELAGTVLICGGIYGNLEALDALLAEAGRLGIPFTQIIHTGDVAAYCADPEICAERLAEIGVPAIRGNVEEQLVAGSQDCACGFDAGSSCAELAESWYPYIVSRMTPEAIGWIRALPHHITFRMEARLFRVIHGGVNRMNRYIFGSQNSGIFRDELDVAQADCVVAGHSGLPFTRIMGERAWHNSGAVGMPANDGTPRVWFSLIRAEVDRIVFEHRSLAYDHRLAAHKLREAGLPESYARCLETGLWPSLDLLPRGERAVRGTPLANRSIEWRTMANAT